MRQLSERKTRLIFETADRVFERGQWRQVIVEAQPAQALIRLKGLHGVYAIDYASIYSLGAKRAAEFDRVEKTTRRRPGRPKKSGK